MSYAQMLALAAIACLVSARVSAQEEKPKRDRAADLMFGFGNTQSNLSISYQFGWRLGKKHKLRMGVGVRVNRFSAADKYFVTAPAKLAKGVSGPGVLFKDPIKENMDSVQLAFARAVSINVLIHLSYDITDKLSAGFNIDVIGFSTGGSSSGSYINGNAPDGVYSKPINASPSPFNLLLIGENDLGSLNSEFFLKYAFTDKWAVKGGVQHIFIEYTTDTKVQQFPEPNDRFRITPTVACFGVVYTLR